MNNGGTHQKAARGFNTHVEVVIHEATGERTAQSGWHLPSHNAQHVETLVPTQLAVEVSEVIDRC